jgi:nitroreductase
MDTFEAIKKRCSVREFSDKPLDKNLIEKIVDCGRLAPTARKVEPWEFIAVTDRNKLKAIAGLADNGTFIENCACAIVICCKETKYYLEDGCAATENMLIASAALGIGSCWVAGDKKPYCLKVMQLVSAPEGYKLVSMIALGYPYGSAAVTLEKRRLCDVLHWEKF